MAIKKEDIIQHLQELQSAIESDDAKKLMETIEFLRIYEVDHSPLVDYARGLLIKLLTEYVFHNGRTEFKSKNEFGAPSIAVYTVKDGILYRNGNEAKWYPYYKLARAYKQVPN